MSGTDTSKRRRPRRHATKSQVITIGNRKFVASGLSAPVLGDLYYYAMKSSWVTFFGSFAGFFLIVNFVFASLYRLGTDPIANVRPDHFRDLLYFSIETLGTVGYGDMHPQTDYAHVVATVEIFTGMSLLAVVTGLVFARFSRPRARLIFAQDMVIGPHDKKPNLMVRMANERHNMISEASAKLWVVLETDTAEGDKYRRFHELKLERAENPVFVLSWTIFHIIDESSILFGLADEDLDRFDAVFVVTFTGLDEAANQRVSARKSYAHTSIRWDHRYADVLDATDEGLPRIDYRKFHDTLPLHPGRATGEAADRPAG